MWIRDIKILKQSDRGNGIFVTLFELILWTKKTRYHTTAHAKPLEKKDFEEVYRDKDYIYFPLSKAELMYSIMTSSDIKIVPIDKLLKPDKDDNRRKEVLPRGYKATNSGI
jgi:hypothetical protein